MRRYACFRWVWLSLALLSFSYELYFTHTEKNSVIGVKKNHLLVGTAESPSLKLVYSTRHEIEIESISLIRRASNP